MELIKENPVVIYHSLIFLRNLLEEQRQNRPRGCTVAPDGQVICIDDALCIYDKCIDDYYSRKKGEIHGTKRTT